MTVQLKDTKKWLYIVAYTPKDHDEEICFAHRMVIAEDEEDAYYIGMESYDDDIVKANPGCHLRNNYVISIDEIAARCKDLDRKLRGLIVGERKP